MSTTPETAAQPSTTPENSSDSTGLYIRLAGLLLLLIAVAVAWYLNFRAHSAAEVAYQTLNKITGGDQETEKADPQVTSKFAEKLIRTASDVEEVFKSMPTPYSGTEDKEGEMYVARRYRWPGPLFWQDYHVDVYYTRGDEGKLLFSRAELNREFNFGPGGDDDESEDPGDAPDDAAGDMGGDDVPMEGGMGDGADPPTDGEAAAPMEPEDAPAPSDS